ncbi:FRG domain-containing protein [Methanosarcina sp. 2.H.A.1B.4]|uniref:FRG domain-containing protein n=1 Tax=Methanosarcina sp. 2.H.A.1B.4 TaxID=1483600 RepID=UPI000621CB9F|nr:FRG domain-containing protein [Methanosarcina sp. 2.H.A.1B.4]KKG13065.1 hypothetical protein EO92_07815 [Methanosarcina sp. 2.H.A.1B.4]
MEVESYKSSECLDGVCEVELSSWKMFYSFITGSMLDNIDCVFRGQRDISWKLEPSFDRLVQSCGKKPTKDILNKHLQSFKYSKRGRVKNFNANEFSENDWWALGQHYGLVSPLLDWTKSPFIAAYFAFLEKDDGNNTKRVVYVLSKEPLLDVFKYPEVDYNQYEVLGQYSPSIQIFYPEYDDNPRVIAQQGLFVRCPTGIDIETYVKTRFKHVNNEIVLMKILIPGDEISRKMFLKSLNRMNINHLTLFPDLQGASIYCNTHIEIDNY